MVKEAIGIMPTKAQYKPLLTVTRKFVFGEGRRVVRSGPGKYELVGIDAKIDGSVSVLGYSIEYEDFLHASFPTTANVTHSFLIYVSGQYLLNMLNTFKSSDILDIDMVDNKLKVRYDKNIASFKGIEPDDIHIYSISKS
jgi:hypothetical protein